jgi:hypothetical protein
VGAEPHSERYIVLVYMRVTSDREVETINPMRDGIGVVLRRLSRLSEHVSPCFKPQDLGRMDSKELQMSCNMLES